MANKPKRINAKDIANEIYTAEVFEILVVRGNRDD